MTFHITLSTQNFDAGTDIDMCQKFNDTPAWPELCDFYLRFLRANGYYFDVSARLDVSTNPRDELTDLDDTFLYGEEEDISQ